MTELKFALSIEEAADYTGIGRNTLEILWNGKSCQSLELEEKS